MININKYGGLSWDININETDYQTFKDFIIKLMATDYKYITKYNHSIYNGHKTRIDQGDMKKLDMLLTKDAEEYYNLIKNFLSSEGGPNNNGPNNNEPNLTLDDINSYRRMILHIMCKVLSLTYDGIKKNIKLYVPCTEFLPCNKGVPQEQHKIRQFYGEDYICGCELAPNWFMNNHSHNNYEDTIAYSYTFRTAKTGLVIKRLKRLKRS